MFDLIYKKAENEAILYYLFMMSDGEVSSSEEWIFGEICRELKIEQSNKDKIIDECKKLETESTKIYDCIIREKIDEKVQQDWLGTKDPSSLARIIWNLVNLGYADKNYSDNEREIVDFLIARWNINKEIYQEMVDTADTILDLIKQKKWICSTIQNNYERNFKSERIDVEIEKMISDIKLSCEELTM